ncbi:PIN domain-containing protein [Candidatus Saccharibacteria bacterium]|nr:PIN domain-containing protein [Candidatus Saccharibacteria bacterium]
MGVKTNIAHIDTNIIVRLITQDNSAEVKKAEKLIEDKHNIYVLEDAALMEVVFVLMGDFYHFSRQDVADSIKTVMAIDNIYLNKSVISAALDLFVAQPKLSFVDCYLAIMAETSGETPLWTLDKKLATQVPTAKLVA